jgi:energy-converting hydrogenase Eha subunit C
MKEQEATLALWSAVMITFFVALFILSMILYPIGEFKDLTTYSEEYGFRSIAPAIPSFFIAMLHFPFLVGLYCFAREDRKVFALTGAVFGAAYAVLASVNYFTQLTFVFQNIKSAQAGVLEHFLLDNPHSFIFSLEVLAYSFLFIACLFWARLFLVGSLDRLIQILLLATGAIGLLGSLGYVFQSRTLEVAIVAAALPYTAAMILLILRFKRLQREIAE